MEMEYFVPPEDGPHWYEYWCQERYRWFVDLGIPESELRLRPHDAEELSHYSTGTSDVEFRYPWGWGELEGIANRTDFDLTQHTKFSGAGPELLRPGERPPLRAARHRARRSAPIAPRSRSCSRPTTSRRCRTTRAARRSAPCCACTRSSRRSRSRCCRCPRTSELVPVADEVAGTLRPHFQIDVDVAGSIGRRYRRQDEVGTPLCVTIDFDTLDDKAVTIRDRDTMDQDARPDRRAARRARAAPGP